MDVTTERPAERRAPERRMSAESVYRAIGVLMGPRLRKRSAFQLRVALEAMVHGSGLVLVVSVPASRNAPIEIQTYPEGVTLGIAETVHIAV